MKNTIIKSSLAITVFLGLSSCSREDFEIMPKQLDTPASVFVNETGFRSTLDGAYDAMKSMYNGDAGNVIITADVLADNLILNPLGRRSNADAYEWGFSSTSGSVISIYRNAYFVISRINFALDNINALPRTSSLTSMEAEARGLRGLMHFEVARAYSKIPTQSTDANASLGIPYVTKFDPLQRPARLASVSETYSKIIEDLEFAYNNISATNTGNVRLTRTSLAAILNEVYLYMGNYQKVIELGEAVISASPSVGSRANFTNIWLDASDDGVLFKLSNAAQAYDNFIVGVAYNQNSGGIRSEYNVDYDLFIKYQSSDIRRSAYLLTAPFSGTNFNHVIKYRARTGSTVAGLVNPKYARTAEVYLNTAEAYMRASTPNAARALQLLNTLRQNRYSGFTAGAETGTTLLNAILAERRLELAFENDRFWTLKRLGEAVNRSNFGPNADGSGAGPVSSISSLPASSHKWQLPIPQSEIDINPNMKQNPGY